MPAVVQNNDNDIERKEEKAKIKSELSNFIPPDQITSEMKKIARYYGTDLANANDSETKKILNEVSSLNDELVGMREETM